MSFDGEALGKTLTAVVRDFLARSTATLLTRIESLESQNKQLALQIEGDVGKLLENIGKVQVPKDGRDIEPAVIMKMVTDAVAALPPAKDGKDADPAVVTQAVADALAAMPVAKDGQDGKDGQDVDPEHVEKIVTELVASELAKPDVADAIEAMVHHQVKKAVSALPRPKDGADADPLHVEMLVAATVKEAIAALPAPQEIDLAALVESVAPKIKELVDAIPAPNDGRDIDAQVLSSMIKDAVASLPAPKELDLELVADMVLASIPAPKDGKDGRDVDPQVVLTMVKDAVAALPAPKEIEPAAVADLLMPKIKEMVDAIPVPKDGQDVDPVAVATLVDSLVTGAVAKAVAALPAPKELEPLVLAESIMPLVKEMVDAIPKPRDGKDADPLQIAVAVKEAVAALPAPDPTAVAELLMPQVKEMVDAMPRPKDGEPGRGITTEDFRQLFEAEQAKWALDFERRATDLLQRQIERIPVPKDGADGMGFDDMSVEHDGDGNVRLIFTKGDRSKEFPIRIPRQKDAGVWREGEYREGDGVTWGGSYFFAQKDSPVGKPGESPDWRMSVKRGRDGRDAKVEPGNSGPPPIVKTK